MMYIAISKFLTNSRNDSNVTYLHRVLGKSNSSTLLIGPSSVSSRNGQKARRSFHVHGLFGGKKDNNGDDNSSKVQNILFFN